jgi:acyl carrier protein
MSENIEQTIIKTIAETLKIEESTISTESKLVDDLGADSLDLVEVMMAIEAAFDCDIPDEEAGKISTVADAVNYVKQHIST